MLFTFDFFPAGYDGYATVINPLGFIHLETGGFRPSWFFAEPSYLGFYLGNKFTVCLPLL